LKKKSDTHLNTKYVPQSTKAPDGLCMGDVAKQMREGDREREREREVFLPLSVNKCQNSKCIQRVNSIEARVKVRNSLTVHGKNVENEIDKLMRGT